MTIIPGTLVAEGPRGENLQTIPRTRIPLAATFPTLASVGGAPVALSAVAQPVVTPPVPPRAPTPGNLLYTSFYDWYYRIHIVPTSISLGNLSGDTTREVLVWNAFFDSKQLEAFGLFNADGITINAPVVPPAPIGPLRMLVYVVNVSATGPAIIDATMTWTIAGNNYVVPITGRRSVLFPFRPNWADRVLETLSWTTTVTQAWSGREQRMSIARNPRRSIRYSYQAKGEGSRLLDAVLFGWMGRFYSLPIWNEESRLVADASAGASALQVDTTRMSIAVGSSVTLYHDEFRYEVVEVLSFTATQINTKGVLNTSWAKGTKVIPTISAMPQLDVRTSRVLPSIGTGSIEFLIDPSSPLIRLPATTPPLSYRGTEVSLDETDWAQAIDNPYTSNRRDIDSGIGPILVSRKGDYPIIGRSFRWVCRDRAYADNLRAFFGRRRGRLAPVWLPSGTEDFVLAQPVDPVTPSLVVRKSSYGALVWPDPIRRDIVIRMRNGTVFMRRITDVAEGAEVTVLTLDQGFGEAFDPTDVKRISYLGFYRLGSDSVTFTWYTNYVAVVETNFVLTEPDQ